MWLYQRRKVVTDSQTDRSRHSICNNMPHSWMRCGLIIETLLMAMFTVLSSRHSQNDSSPSSSDDCSTLSAKLAANLQTKPTDSTVHKYHCHVLLLLSARNLIYQLSLKGFSALMLLVWSQEDYAACKKIEWLHGYLSVGSCKWFAYDQADATAPPSLASLKSTLV